MKKEYEIKPERDWGTEGRAGIQISPNDAKPTDIPENLKEKVEEMCRSGEFWDMEEHFGIAHDKEFYIAKNSERGLHHLMEVIRKRKGVSHITIHFDAEYPEFVFNIE